MVLLLLCLAQFVAVLDGTLVLVALPVIGRDLALVGGALQWVVTAYVLVFAGCLLVAGRLADAVGRRRVFLSGLALFTTASLGCGIAPTSVGLLAFRAAQGLGGALAAPAALAMIVDVFPAGRPRERAVAAWTGVAAVGGAAGLVLGGVIAQALGWRWIFLVNVPVGLAVLALAPRILPESQADDVPGELDVLGAGMATGGLGLLVLALAQAEQQGPLAPLTLAALAGAALLLTALGLRERTTAHPLVPPDLLATRPLRAAVLAGALLTATTSGGGVLASLQLQDVLGLDPIHAGLVLLPFSVAAVVGSLAAPRVHAPASAMVIGGVALVAAGSGVAATGLTTSASATIIVWGALSGFGIGIASVAATTLGASAVPEPDLGSAAGLLNTAAQVGTALGIAGLVLIAGSTHSATAGHRLGFTAASALAAFGAVGLAALLRAARPR